MTNCHVKDQTAVGPGPLSSQWDVVGFMAWRAKLPLP
jgi:hypothetical protein